VLLPAMGFACYARFARCRSAHLSTWARQVNATAFGHNQRSLVALSAVRALCAEIRPSMSFPEQREGSGDAVAQLCAGEAVSDGDSLAELIDQLSGPGAILLTDVLGISIRCLSIPAFDKSERDVGHYLC